MLLTRPLRSAGANPHINNNAMIVPAISSRKYSVPCNSHAGTGYRDPTKRFQRFVIISAVLPYKNGVSRLRAIDRSCLGRRFHEFAMKYSPATGQAQRIAATGEEAM